MNEATIAQTIMTLAILAIFIGFAVWGIRSGQFKNVEETKYRMLSDKKEQAETPETPVKKGDRKP